MGRWGPTGRAGAQAWREVCSARTRLWSLPRAEPARGPRGPGSRGDRSAGTLAGADGSSHWAITQHLCPDPTLGPLFPPSLPPSSLCPPQCRHLTALRLPVLPHGSLWAAPLGLERPATLAGFSWPCSLASSECGCPSAHRVVTGQQSPSFVYSVTSTESSLLPDGAGHWDTQMTQGTPASAAQFPTMKNCFRGPSGRDGPGWWAPDPPPQSRSAKLLCSEVFFSLYLKGAVWASAKPLKP